MADFLMKELVTWRSILLCYPLHYDEANNSSDTNKCTVLQFMLTIFHKAPTCFGAVISPFLGSWHQHYLKTYSHRAGHNYRTHVVV